MDLVCVIIYMLNAIGAGKAKHGLPGRKLTSIVINKMLPSNYYSALLLATYVSLLSVLLRSVLP